MLNYILRRLLLIPVTLFGIMVLNFAIVQFAPGGPVEQMIAQLQGTDVSATARISNQGADSGGGGGASGGNNFSSTSNYRGAQGLDPEIITQLEKQFGFDKPAYERFWMMMKNYLTFDFGQSYFQDRDVVDIVIDKMPVSISLGLWSTLIIYIISVPLGVAKAVRDGSNFDVWSSAAIIVGYAIPGFLFAVMLIVVFAGGTYFDLFPLRGLTSSNFDELSLLGKVADYFWHLALPITALTIGGFTTLTMLTKNSFLDEINKQYVVTARAKGLTEKRVLYGHVFRNAMLLVIAGFPSALIGLLFTGSVLIEVIFSLDGLGLLGFEAVMKRDYPVMFATLYLFTLFGLVLNLISDLSYHLIDPRIDFEAREN
ncbi:microcin C transport system permease protein [Thalassospira sp. MBR-102]|jgi:microcin C transport system permease protein|uniref:Microcin ABC transporter permease n=1 Tax=Thalassospira xiamenensis TaxID=220697 RepID=A0ABR5Y7G2_9PROT|nr:MULTISPECIES: microcin C ABC transporter permease YejB [Thalassospira]KZD06562.1 microcin ABC transporter permease [Thalassospira xiamenensis]KZD10843.1 microcin ABC transporter permease [Thalassospira xiamenensis]MAB33426.1 microcin C ABC transporter permease YejB [Thalassospira sp.]MBA05870.1 microcin C ABC transporter permease YejB [Thalassospira sp.]MCD1592748.1 microcin C ABC transporter permease YejB [Thalassospira xiamenensis]|tara:strand:- start:49 stop:1158 length:1110 start_codon:yes stop_codon:yes gene_type:complete